MSEAPDSGTGPHRAAAERADESSPHGGTEVARDLGRAWNTADVRLYLRGDLPGIRPTVGRRSDGQCLLYPGSTHSLASEPEAGKSWLALAICVQEIKAGRPVVYLDYEDGPVGISQRLVALGATAEDLAGFTLIHPQDGASGDDVTRLCEAVTAHHVSLVVLDGITEAFTLQGLSNENNQDAASFFGFLPNRLAQAGAAVLLLDHEVKRSNDRGRFALGAGHKLAAIRGAAFKLRSRERFSIGRSGSSELYVVKDRPGAVRRLGTQIGRDDVLVATLNVRSGGPDMVEVSIDPPDLDLHFREEESNKDRIKKEMALALQESQDDQEGGFEKKSDVYGLIQGRTQDKSDALRELIEDDFVSPKPYRLLRPYPIDGDDRDEDRVKDLPAEPGRAS
ncbi:AAA family ATPase [Nocardioides mangrovicus]|uniref:AAA family ATPase n=1 Tax=Nocardioides mangrovicus TaxID=2478913 RepID=UPI00131412CF|nr:AAA family ATPase [Nocardioides mangrovicus]